MTDNGGAQPPIVPLRNYLLAQEDEEDRHTSFGMIVPSNTLGQPAYAKLVEVGPDAAADFAVDEVVLYRKPDSVNVYAMGREYILFKSDAVMGKVRASIKPVEDDADESSADAPDAKPAKSGKGKRKKD